MDEIIAIERPFDGHLHLHDSPMLSRILPYTAEIFEKQNALGLLESFTSRYGAKFYDLPLNNGKINLVRKPMTIPLECHGTVPFLAGQKIPWSISL